MIDELIFPPHIYGKDYVPPSELAELKRMQARLYDILSRFVEPETDTLVSDRSFVGNVISRWAEDQGVHLGDVGDGVDLTGLFDHVDLADVK